MTDLMDIYALEIIKWNICERDGDLKGAAFHKEAAEAILRQIEAQDGQSL